MAKQCWSQAVLESGSWVHNVLQTPALVLNSIIFSHHRYPANHHCNLASLDDSLGTDVVLLDARKSTG